jgi:DNA-binding response OmpR family regulator
MSPTRSLLVVEDDDTLRQLLADQLVSSGLFLVAEAATLAKASQHLNAPDVQCDAIILDISLPDGDGCDFCARIRKQGHMMPILMLTGAAGEDDVVNALNAGANDYLVKPFRVNELLARLQAQLRLFDMSENAALTIGSYTFRPGAKLLIGANKTRRLRLTAKEVDLLKFLHRHANLVVSRQTLLEAVWGYHAGVTTHTLETHIYRLRQKIETDPADARLLMTVPGGYRLNLGPVAQHAAE